MFPQPLLVRSRLGKSIQWVQRYLWQWRMKCVISPPTGRCFSCHTTHPKVISYKKSNSSTWTGPCPFKNWWNTRKVPVIMILFPIEPLTALLKATYWKVLLTFIHSLIHWTNDKVDSRSHPCSHTMHGCFCTGYLHKRKLLKYTL